VKASHVEPKVVLDGYVLMAELEIHHYTLIEIPLQMDGEFITVSKGETLVARRVFFSKEII